MAINVFWTHGVATQIERPERVIDPRWRGDGLRVRQEAGTDNWFHLAIPSLRVYDSDYTIYLEKVGIQVDLNENAVIRAVHLWDGKERVERWDSLDLRGPSIDQGFEKRHRVLNGIVVCIFVDFLTYEVGGPIGEAVFIGAGANYSQHG